MICFILLIHIFIIPFLCELHASEVQNSTVQLNPQEVANQILFDAIEAGKLDGVKAAFSAGANINAKNKDNLTPVMLAVGYGKEDILRYLIEEKGANYHQGPSDWNLLTLAANFGYLNIVKYLMDEKRVYDNQIDQYGYTAFYSAADQGHLNVVKYFVERPVFNAHIDGVVAMSLASHNNHQAVIDYLATKGIALIPKAGESSGLKSIFYNDKANANITFDPLEVLVYNKIPIAASSSIESMLQGGTMFIYQLKVLQQSGTEEACVAEQLRVAVQKLGGTTEMHCNANPILGGTCGYHAIKNSLLSLMILYDYDRSIITCNENNKQQCKQSSAWVSSDIESLRTLITKDFNCELFMEQIHAKTFMVKPESMFFNEVINIPKGFDIQRNHISRHDMDATLASIMKSRYQSPREQYNNSFSFVDEDTIEEVQRTYCIEQSFINCQTIYESKNSFVDILKQIQNADLLQQIVLFRTNNLYRHAFILTLNESRRDGREKTDRMHTIAVIIDKRGSIANVILCESNNMPTFIIKEIVYDLLHLFIDDKKCTLSKKQINQLRFCAANKFGHRIIENQEELPSFESLVRAYEQALAQYKKNHERDDIHKALFLFSKIEYVYNQAKNTADNDEDKKIFNAIQKMLPDRLKNENGIRKEEIVLHSILQEIENRELNDKLRAYIWIGNIAMVKEALQIGASPVARNDYGDTPLLVAIRPGNLDIIKYLHTKGASIDDANLQGETPLMMAAQFGHLNIVEYLIKNSANVNKTDNQGMTALMYAAAGYDSTKKLAIVTMLVEQGNADPAIISNNDQTAIDIAKKYNSPDIVQFLEKYIASKQKQNPIED
jgi:ankyrin repeat protein